MESEHEMFAVSNREAVVGAISRCFIVVPETHIPSFLLKGFRGGAAYYVPKEQLQHTRFRTQLSKAHCALALIQSFMTKLSSESKQKQAVNFLILLSIAFSETS